MSLSSRKIGRFAIATLAIVAACNPDRLAGPSNQKLPARETRKIPPPTLGLTRPTSPLMSITSCGPTAVYNLTDLNRTPGTVSVTNDAQNLYVIYATPQQHWWISDTRLAVAKTAAGIPRSDNGDPDPWSFPYSGVHEPPITSVTYTLPLSELNVHGGDTVIVSAMAGVVHPVDENNYDGDWEWVVMWGVSGTGGQAQFENKYKIDDCGQPPPPPPASTGIFTITFDDGWKTTYTNAFPVLSDLGLRGNVAVNPDPIDGGWTDYMTLANLNELYAAGWSIVSHSLSHRDLTTLSDSELHRELRDSKAWVVNHGFGPSDVFVVPFHSWGTRERDSIKQYYSRTRGFTADQFWPPLYQKYPITQPYDLTGFEPEWAPFTSEAGRAETMAVIRDVIQNGEYVDIFFHKITQAQLPAFRELMTQIAQYKANLRTWAEF